jgi:hypothetical protein
LIQLPKGKSGETLTSRSNDLWKENANIWSIRQHDAFPDRGYSSHCVWNTRKSDKQQTSEQKDHGASPSDDSVIVFLQDTLNWIMLGKKPMQFSWIILPLNRRSQVMDG